MAIQAAVPIPGTFDTEDHWNMTWWEGDLSDVFVCSWSIANLANFKIEFRIFIKGHDTCLCKQNIEKESENLLEWYNFLFLLQDWRFGSE